MQNTEVTRSGRRRSVRGAILGCLSLIALLAPPPAAAQAPLPDPADIAASIQNVYLRVLVSPEHGWMVTRIQGDPLEPRDDNFYVTPPNYAGTSATLWMQSSAGINGGLAFPFAGEEDFDPELGGGVTVTFPTVTPTGDGIVSSRRFSDPAVLGGSQFLVTQRLTLVRDLVRVEYEVFNEGPMRAVGLRLAVDPSPGPDNTGVTPLFSHGTGAIGTELEVRSEDVPDRWFAHHTTTDPFSSFQQVLRGMDATPPDRVVFATFGRITAGDPPLPGWDITPDPNTSIAQEATAAGASYWLPRVLSMRQTRRYVTYVGVGVAGHGRGPGLLGAVQTPHVLPLIGGRAAPGGFPLIGWAHNLQHDLSIPEVHAIVELPLSLGFASSDPDQSIITNLGGLGAVGNNHEQAATWLVEPTGRGYGVQDVSVVFNPSFGGPVRATRKFVIPHEDRVFLETQYQMITIPYTFLDNSPDVALNMPAASFRALRWNPHTLTYHEVDRLVPGESIWIRREAAQGALAQFQNATPVQIAPGQVRMNDLPQGWNQVGNPTPWPMRVQEIRFVRPGFGSPVSLDTAMRSNWIGSTLWRYDVSLGRYVQLANDGILQPGDGIWVRTFQNLSIIWPRPAEPGFAINP